MNSRPGIAAAIIGIAAAAGVFAGAAFALSPSDFFAVIYRIAAGGAIFAAAAFIAVIAVISVRFFRRR